MLIFPAMKKIKLILFLFLYSYTLNALAGNPFYSYHCGYLKSEDKSYTNLWSTGLSGPTRMPKFGETQDFGSFIYGTSLAVCMMTEGNETTESFNLYVNIYEGDKLNFAPGQCSFLGASSYMPYGVISDGSEAKVIAEHITRDGRKTILVFHRTILDPSDYPDDKCAKDLEAYLINKDV